MLDVGALALRIEAIGFDQVERGLVRIDRAARTTATGLKQTDDAAARAQRSVTALQGAVSALGVAFAASKVVTMFQTAAAASDELSKSQLALSGTAKISGVALGTLSGLSKRAQDSFKLSAVTANGLSTEIAKLTSKAGDIKQADATLRAFVNIGAARGMGVAETLNRVQQAILGVDDGTDKLFNKNPSAIYKEYADKIGVAVAKLTEQQKAQALVNAALEDGKKVGDAYNEFLGTTAGKSAAAAEETRKFQQALGGALAPLRELGTSAATPVLQLLGKNGTLVIGLGVATVAFGAVTSATLLFKGALVALGGVSLGWMGAAAIAAGVLAAAFVKVATSARRAREEMEGKSRERLGSMNAQQLEGNIAGLEMQKSTLAAQLRPVYAGLGGEEVQRRNAENAPLHARLKVLMDELAIARKIRAERVATAATESASGDTATTTTTTSKNLYDSDGNRRGSINYLPSGEEHDAALARARRIIAATPGYSGRARAPGPTMGEIISRAAPGWESDANATVAGVKDALLPKGMSEKALAESKEELQRMSQELLVEIGSWKDRIAESLAHTLADGFASGIATAVRTGNLGEGFKELTAGLLSGLGGALIDIGKQTLITAQLLENIKNAIMSFVPGGAIAGSIALIALGATLQGLGGAVSGRGGGRAGRGGSSRGSSGLAGAGGLGTYTDRGIIGAPSSTIADGLQRVASRPAALGGQGPTPTPVPPLIFQATIIGTNDANAQRQLALMVERGMRQNR